MSLTWRLLEVSTLVFDSHLRTQE